MTGWKMLVVFHHVKDNILDIIYSFDTDTTLRPHLIFKLYFCNYS